MKLFELTDNKCEKNDLHEETIGEVSARWTPKKMSDAEIIAWCQEKASGFMQHSEGIYRGTYEGLSGLLNTKKLNRKSANTHNTYNLWIDNHPEWKKYPKRSQSLICSNRQDGAEAFGEIYLIIPPDGTKIGVCPYSDIWGSFKDVEDIYGERSADADSFVSLLTHVGIDASNWSSIEHMSKLINVVELESMRIKDEGYVASVKKMIAYMKKRGFKNIYEMLTHVFDPVYNDFSLVDSVGFDMHGEREVWLGETDIMQVEINEMSDKLHEFFEGHFTL